MARMRIFTPAEHTAFETPPVFTPSERQQFFAIPPSVQGLLDVHFISSLPVILRSACKAWVDRGPVQIVAAED